ncbi:MAG: hypothetical protein SPL08_04955 [Pseudomonadota bacterium]|nr:hypothetical protein [Pseudomonadota bacterium]
MKNKNYIGLLFLSGIYLLYLFMYSADLGKKLFSDGFLFSLGPFYMICAGLHQIMIRGLGLKPSKTLVLYDILNLLLPFMLRGAGELAPVIAGMYYIISNIFMPHIIQRENSYKILKKDYSFKYIILLSLTAWFWIPIAWLKITDNRFFNILLTFLVLYFFSWLKERQIQKATDTLVDGKKAVMSNTKFYNIFAIFVLFCSISLIFFPDFWDFLILSVLIPPLGLLYILWFILIFWSFKKIFPKTSSDISSFFKNRSFLWKLCFLLVLAFLSPVLILFISFIQEIIASIK